MSKNNMNYSSMKELDHVQSVIDDANDAIKNPAKGLKESAISEVLGGALGAGVGGGLSFGALYGLGTVGLSAVRRSMRFLSSATSLLRALTMASLARIAS